MIEGSRSPFSLSRLFSASTFGGIFDPSDFTRTRQTYNAPASAVSAAGDPIGLMLNGVPSDGITNLLIWTDAVDNTAWTKTNVTVTANVRADRNGVPTADMASATVGAGTYTESATITAGTETYITGVDIEQGTATASKVQLVFSGGNTYTAAITWSGGVPTITAADSASSGDVSGTLVTGGIWRVTVRGANTSRTAVSTTVQPGGASTGTVYVSRHNLQVGAVEIDYQPNAGSLGGSNRRTGGANQLVWTQTLATQTVTTVATPYTLSFTGTGTVTLSGTSTAGPLVGSGASRVTLTFTPTAGTLTLTVTGTVTDAQLEFGSSFTTYSRNMEVIGGLLTSLVLYQATSGNRGTQARRPRRGIANRLPYNAYTDGSSNAPIAAAGSELIPDGLFASDMGSWTNASTGTGTAAWSNSGGVGHVAISGGASGVGIAQRSFTVVAGQVYTLIMTAETNLFTGVVVGTSAGASDLLNLGGGWGAGTTRFYQFTPVASGTAYLQVKNSANNTADLYVVSCRQQRLPRPSIFYPTGWSFGTRTLFTVVGVGTSGGYDYFDVRLQLPVTGAAGGSITVYLTNSADMAAASGQTWSFGSLLALTAGDLTNVTSIKLTQIERGSGSSQHSGSDIKSSLTSSLQSFSYSVALNNGVATTGNQVGFVIGYTSGTVVDLTLRIACPQAEIAAASTAPQRVATAYDIAEIGQLDVWHSVFDGTSDGYETGMQSAGTASWFAAAGQAWALEGDFRTIATGVAQTICAKASATAGNRTLMVYIDTDNLMKVNCRGTVTSTGITVTDGVFHVWELVWDGTTLTLWLDGVSYSITVGSAAEEVQNFTIGYRTSSSPASFFNGYNDVVVDIDRGLSTAERSQSHLTNNTTYRYGLPA